MGLRHDDNFKRLKIMQDADAIVADCRHLIAEHGIDPVVAREVVIKAMLAEQLLALGRPEDRSGSITKPPGARTDISTFSTD